MARQRVFLFLGRLRPGELFRGFSFNFNIDDFKVSVTQDGAVSSEYRGDYKENFDREIRDLAILALRCVALSQLLDTHQLIDLELHNWIEFQQVPGTPLVTGFYWQPTNLPLDNSVFIKGFRDGTRFAEVPYLEPACYYALQDYGRAMQSVWDEAIYHCHHSLENVKHYFGSWDEMREKLGVTEASLREITDVSNQLIRHGGKWGLMSKLSQEDRVRNLNRALETTEKVLSLFRNYLTDKKLIRTVAVHTTEYTA